MQYRVVPILFLGACVVTIYYSLFVSSLMASIAAFCAIHPLCTILFGHMADRYHVTNSSPEPKARDNFVKNSWVFTWNSVYYISFLVVIMYFDAAGLVKDPLQGITCQLPGRLPKTVWNFFLVFQLAYYIHELIWAVVVEKLSDDWTMLFHHFVSLLLTGAVFKCSDVAVPGIVLGRFTDAPLTLAKLFHYTQFNQLANLTFGFLLLGFVVTRTVSVPLIWNICNTTSSSIPCQPLVCVGGVVLQILNWYWLFLLLSVAFKILRGEKVNTKNSQ
eukprot:TRINITY_DN52068_c0_g1_i1.p1 TRINITY_DN52068_c0_g1~~TRINITY_DN52068_c0_g1_i1.p1  ORF type:complete len:293 (-),score=11.97 TRINITY_DN52068_c0_g1_i1:230-1051(-)